MASTTIGEMLDEFLRQVNSGTSPKLFFSEKILPEVVGLLKREGFGISEEILDRIPNQAHREVLKTILYSTCAFSVAGAIVGANVGGPHGLFVGAAVGAGLGLAAGVYVVGISLDPDPTRGGYVLSTI